MEVIIGVDIGTGSTKTIAYDPVKFKVLADHQEFYPIIKNGRRQEQDPEVIYKAFLKSVLGVQAKLPDSKVIALTFSSALHSIILMDKYDQPLTNCILWSDSRSHVQTQKLKKDTLSFDIYSNTGTPIHTMSPLLKIRYFREEEKSLFDQAKKFISIKSYILFQLIGKYYEDHSLASASGLFDIKNRTWFDQAIDYAGLNEEQLPIAVNTTFVIDNLPQQAVKALQLPKDVVIIIGGGDGPLANLGTLSIGEGQGCITFGTSGAIRTANKTLAIDQSQSLFTYILDQEYYVSGGATNNGGIVLKWLATSFLDQKINQLDIEKIIDQLKFTNPGSDGLICLPWILGERAPVWDANAKGIFAGLSQHHTKAHFIRSGVEGILYNAKIILNILESLTKEINIINFNGGLAKSPIVSQMLANILAKKVNVSTLTDASTMGAIYLCMKTLKFIDSYKDLTSQTSDQQLFLPGEDNRKVYESSFDLFEKMVKNYQLFS